MIWVNIGSDKGLSPVLRQAINWTNAGLLSIGLMETNFRAIWSGIIIILIQENAFENVVWQNGGHLVQWGDELKQYMISPL